MGLPICMQNGQVETGPVNLFTYQGNLVNVSSNNRGYQHTPPEVSFVSGSTSTGVCAIVTSLRELRAEVMLPLRRVFVGMAAIGFSLLLEASDLESSSTIRERWGAIL